MQATALRPYFIRGPYDTKQCSYRMRKMQHLSTSKIDFRALPYCMLDCTWVNTSSQGHWLLHVCIPEMYALRWINLIYFFAAQENFKCMYKRFLHLWKLQVTCLFLCEMVARWHKPCFPTTTSHTTNRHLFLYFNATDLKLGSSTYNYFSALSIHIIPCIKLKGG